MLRKILNFPYYIRRAAREGVTWAYTGPETWMRRAARWPLYQFHRLIYRAADRSQPCVYITSGVSAADGQPLRVAFVGRWQTSTEPSLQRWEEAIFQPGNITRADAGAFRGSFGRHAEGIASQVDLVLMAGDGTEVGKPRAAIDANGAWALSPASLRLVFNFRPGEAWEQVVARAGMAAIRDNLQTSGFRYYLSHRRSDLDYFYESMYAPTVRKLRRGYGERMRADEASAMFDDRGAILILEDATGQMIAGALVSATRRGLSAPGSVHRALAGVLDGSVVWSSRGALEACDYFGMQWASALGCASYTIGGALPFASLNTPPMSPGFRCALDPLRPEKVLAWAAPGSQVGAAWLKANPFMQLNAMGGVDVDGCSLHEVPVTGHAPDMDTSPLFRIEAYGRITEEIKKPVDHGLFEHALAAIGSEVGKNFKPFSIAIRDTQNRVIGGLIGRITWNYMHIDSLWVSPEYRGHHLGTRLMHIAEATARTDQLNYITVETTSFEAIGFYPRLGYEVIAQIDDVPPGHTFYYLKKKL